MRRFEFREGKSSKFWEVSTEGDLYKTRHGRIGSDGREGQLRCDSEDGARRRAESTIASKLNTGYIEIRVDENGIVLAAEDEEPPTLDVSPVAVLERSLIADPSDLHAWSVYSDALQKRGDSRGELVALQIAQAQPGADTKALRRQEKQLIQGNAEAMFGKFVSRDGWRECFGWTLTMGHWDRIRLWVDADHSDTDIAEALAYALAHPSATFLRGLDLGLPSADGSADYRACVRALVERGPMPSLRRLCIGDFDFPAESEISWVQVGDISKLWSVLPQIEKLRLQGAGIHLGVPKSETLRELEVHTGGLPGPSGEAMGRARLPKLERLSLWYGTVDYGGSCTPAQVQGLLNNSGLGSLRHLGLQNADFADTFTALLAGTALLPRLETLDLSMGTMTDVGAEHLLADAGAFRHLECLNLEDNFLSPQMCTRLEAALPVGGLSQKNDGDDRYVSVGE